MPIVHQDQGFDFTIKPEDKDPPKVHITGAGGKYMLVRIGVPGGEIPYVERYEKVDQDEVNWAWDTIQTYQENFLIAWKRIHGGEWKTTRGPVKIGPPVVGCRLRLKTQTDLEEIKEMIGGIADQRFYKLKKRIIADLDGAGFKDIDLGLYIRLGVWSHIGSSYRKTAAEVKALCKAIFGYAIPEKIGAVLLRDYRYRLDLSKVRRIIQRFHEEKLRP